MNTPTTILTIFVFLFPLAFCLDSPAPAPSAPVSVSTPAPAPAPTHGGHALIDKACAESPRKEFCLSLLKSFPESQTADLKGLVFLTFKAIANNATAASKRIKALLNDSIAEPAIDDGLSTCDDAYLDLVNQIDDSVNSLVSDKFGEIKTWLMAAIADIDTCAGGLQGHGGSAVDMIRRNRVIRQLCNTALSIVRALGPD
ncbi:cell wall / vacuolar inhibitor of fructosidase 2 [Diospyros lotus]|uniref:cell wall / vacuolar inhibitor of fructosidase 2 n=1 Tax=Diospyros lotus TaxID=55363 RepID=UPI0022598D82|nr:cell wall / vacuolar inhibitor of fructosidase 2 [Diospyros lotus]